MASPKKTAAAGSADRSLRIVAKKDGFRRAGREWTGTTFVKLSDISPETREQLEAETMLIVDEVDTPKAEEPAKA